MRKTKDVEGQFGRDKGRLYRITEMSASKAEKWATRLMLALGRSGVTMPGGLDVMGMIGLSGFASALGIRALLAAAYEDAEPLLDEMMECVTIVRDPKVRNDFPIIEEDIEEVQTRLMLRDEVVALHIDFFPSERLRMLWQQLTTLATTLSTRTSPPPSEQSLADGSPPLES